MLFGIKVRQAMLNIIEIQLWSNELDTDLCKTK